MSGLFVVILVVVILVVLFAPMLSAQFKHLSGVNKKAVAKHWQRTESYLGQGEAGVHKAITDADKLLDYVLRRGGFSGKTMGERLQKANRKFSSTDGVWRAHKLRNKIVHETGFRVGERRGRQAMNEFRRALKDLGAL